MCKACNELTMSVTTRANAGVAVDIGDYSYLKGWKDACEGKPPDTDGWNRPYNRRAESHQWLYDLGYIDHYQEMHGEVKSRKISLPALEEHLWIV